MFVAIQPGSGASVTAHNFASSLSAIDKNVLILDANIRKPNQHKLMKCANESGWSNSIVNNEDITNNIIEGPIGTPSLLPFGNSNITPEILESKIFANLLSQLESRYDLVIIDAPPLLLTSESQMLTKIVDAVAIVVNAQNDKRGMVQRLQNTVKGNRAELLGIVLNKVKSSAGGYFRKNYEAFHRYSNTGKQNNASRNAAVAAMNNQSDNKA